MNLYGISIHHRRLAIILFATITIFSIFGSISDSENRTIKSSNMVRFRNLKILNMNTKVFCSDIPTPDTKVFNEGDMDTSLIVG